MAKFIKSTGEVTDVFPAKEKFSLEEVQVLVGGYFEVIRVGVFPMVMLLNEDGIELDLPVNPVATSMVGEKVLGDVVLLSQDDLA